jgi:hypothetical protein
LPNSDNCHKFTPTDYCFFVQYSFLSSKSTKVLAPH